MTKAIEGGDATDVKLERLQKILAAAGVASRRKAEEIILAGRVQVNGQVVKELGTKHDPARDHIRVDGKLLKGPEAHRYYMLNKPRGYVTTLEDPQKRPTVMDLIAKPKAGPHDSTNYLFPDAGDFDCRLGTGDVAGAFNPLGRGRSGAGGNLRRGFNHQPSPHRHRAGGSKDQRCGREHLYP